jgi:ABC-type uncharacterized transport system permease subunit
MILLVFLTQTLRIAIPYLLASAGGVVSERAGMIALTLEGYMLGGAFCAAAVSYATGSPWLGVLAGVGGGILLALLYAVSTIRFRADQVVVGIAINLLAIGLTRFLLRLFFDSSSNSPRVPGFGTQGGGSGFIALAQNPLVWIGIAGARRGRASRRRRVGGRAGGSGAVSRRGVERRVRRTGRRLSRSRPAPVH